MFKNSRAAPEGELNFILKNAVETTDFTDEHG
jgi:hypothetical protein